MFKLKNRDLFGIVKYFKNVDVVCNLFITHRIHGAGIYANINGV